MTGLGLWLVLILVMIVPKANRTPKTLLILVPLVTVYFGGAAARSQMDENLLDSVVFSIMVYTLAVGSAVLLLLAHRLAARAWYKTLLAAIGIALGIALVGGLSLGVGSYVMISTSVLMGVMMLATVAGYALGARGYGARRTWRFFALQAAGTFVVSLAGVFVGALILLTVIGGGPDGVAWFIASVVIGGLAMGLIVFLITVPFTILGLTSPFFRQRLILLLTPSSLAAGRSSPSSSEA